MPRIVEDEEYLNTRETMKELEASKKHFYDNVRPYLRVYHFDAKRNPWYKRREVIDIKNGKLIRMGNISISGIQKDWSTFLRNLGYHVETKNRGTYVVALPEEAVQFFFLPADEEFVQRRRMTLANGARICCWDTYYPRTLIGDDLERVQNDETLDVVKLIKDKHGLAINVSRDKLTARNASMYEQQLLELMSNDPVLLLYRASYTKNKERLICFSSMTLLGSWFAPEYEYEVHLWDK